MVRLLTHKLLVSVDAVLGLKLFAMAALLPNFVLVWRLQRLESLLTVITGVSPFSLSRP